MGGRCDCDDVMFVDVDDATEKMIYLWMASSSLSVGQTRYFQQFLPVFIDLVLFVVK